MDPFRGIMLKVLSVAVFVAMASCIKWVSADIPPGQTVFFRSLFAIPVIIVWLIYQHDLRHGLETKQPMGHVWRGVVGTTAMALGFTGLGMLPLPEVTAIGYAAPLLTVIFAAMFLGEEVRLFRLSAVALGLVGVVIVLSPRLQSLTTGQLTPTETVGALLILISAVFAALAQVFVRKLVSTERTPAIVFYFSITATLLSLLSLPFGWVIPSWSHMGILVMTGILGGIGQILMTSSYRFAPTSVIAPFEYVSMLFALIIGYSVFGEVPTVTMLIGASIIVFAGLIIIFREHQLGLERSRTRKVMTPQG